MKLFSIFIVALILCIVGYRFFARHYYKVGTVIILNGPSGSGKTSIQKEFQKLMMPELWIKVGIDNLFDAPMPNITQENLHYWQSPNKIRWVEETKDESGNKVITLFVGSEGEKVAYGMNSAIAEYAKNGCNVIVDYISYDQQWFEDLHKKCSTLQTYYVAVDIPIDILEQREEARATSPKGHARSHYFSVHGNHRYHLRVDSSKYTPYEIAQQIKQLI